MPRKGLSITLSYVVIGMIMVITALIVGTGFDQQFGGITDIITGENEQTERDLARQHCLSEKRNLCRSADYDEDSTQWAQDAQPYNDRSCQDWIESGVLGGEVKPCGESYQ